MVKTLKDEIVGALRDAAPYLDEKSEATINKLAAKVESARCENCANYYENFSHCEYDGSYQEPNSFCWNFEQKEK